MLARLYGSAVVARALRGQRDVPRLPRAELEALRDRRIRALVRHAARHVPHYRDWFRRHGVAAEEIRGAAELDALPVLDRDQVRAEPGRFLSETTAGRRSVAFSTSGTTGTPLVVRHDRRSLLENIAWGEREREPLIRLAGGSFRPKEVYVGYESSTFKAVQAFYAESTLMPVKPRRTFVPLGEPIERVLAILERERPDVLVGYGGWIDLFLQTLAAGGSTQTLAAGGAAVPLPKVVLYMGEALPYRAREALEARLGIPILSRYNAVEAFKIGYFCERRTGFHLHEDLCHLRVVDDAGRASPPGVSGAIVITNLVNRGTVLLNYPIGDEGTLAAESCACGRTFRLLASLEGRVEDVLRLPDGRSLHPRAIWEALKSDPDLLQYQLSEHEGGRFELALVTRDESAFQRSAERAGPPLERLLGMGARLEIVRRPEIERGGERKIRAVRALPARD